LFAFGKSTTPESGISPLDTTFTFDSSLNLANATFNCTGPGSVEFFPPDASGTRATITTEGIYYCTASVNDSSGKIYNDTVAITVLSKAEMDAFLKAKWDGMKAALTQGNVDGALNYFAQASRDEFGEIFQILAPQLPSLVSAMREITMIEITENTAEYYITRFQKGVDISYFIYFIRDEDGIWRIQNF